MTFGGGVFIAQVMGRWLEDVSTHRYHWAKLFSAGRQYLPLLESGPRTMRIAQTDDHVQHCWKAGPQRTLSQKQSIGHSNSESPTPMLLIRTSFLA